LEADSGGTVHAQPACTSDISSGHTIHSSNVSKQNNTFTREKHNMENATRI